MMNALEETLRGQGSPEESVILPKICLPRRVGTIINNVFPLRKGRSILSYHSLSPVSA